jgi:hypothetical protein
MIKVVEDLAASCLFVQFYTMYRSRHKKRSGLFPLHVLLNKVVDVAL